MAATNEQPATRLCGLGPAQGFERHAQLVDRIRLGFGIAREEFDLDVLPLLQRFAACVHDLPATPDAHHSEPGGMLRLALETAFFSLQGTDGHIFSGRAPIEQRRSLEPRWRVATFVAGLCVDLHRLAWDRVVTGADGTVWNPCAEPLAVWAGRQNGHTCTVRWSAAVHERRLTGVLLLHHVVPAAMLHWLAGADPVVLDHLLSCLAGTTADGERNVIDKIVRRARALVIDQDCARRSISHSTGTRQAPQTITALRQLIASDPAWQLNASRSRLWWGRDGLFMVWPQGANDLIKVLRSQEPQEAPTTASDVLIALVLAGAVHDAVPVLIHPTDTALWAIAVEPQVILDTTGTGRQVLLDRDLRVPGAARAGPAADTQRSLFDSDAVAAGAVADICTATPSDTTASATPPPDYTLKAPMRLHPGVRDALAAIVQSLNSQSALAWTIPEGLFVPLDEFERLGLSAPVALRALEAAGMLVRLGPDRSFTASRPGSSGTRTGLVIDPRWVDGWDLDTFLAPQRAAC